MNEDNQIEQAQRENQEDCCDSISQYGSAQPNGAEIHCLTIIGQIEGHQELHDSVKTTKYEHIMPLIAAIEESREIKALLVLLNTAGGDVEAGLGIALLGSMDVQESLSAGRLVRLFPDWEFGRSGSLPIWAVTPQRNMQPAKVRLALEHLAQYLKGVPGVFHGRGDGTF